MASMPFVILIKMVVIQVEMEQVRMDDGERNVNVIRNREEDFRLWTSLSLSMCPISIEYV